MLDVQSGVVHNPISVYDDAYIRGPGATDPVSIDAHKQRWPDETPYRYASVSDQADRFHGMPADMEASMMLALSATVLPFSLPSGAPSIRLL